MRCNLRNLLRLSVFALGTAAFAGEAKVTYFTGQTIYLDAGREEGLATGVELTVMRGSDVVATCRVGEISTHKVACVVLSKLLDPTPGDTVTFLGADSAGSAGTGTIKSATARTGRRKAGLRGRIGLRYLYVRDRSSGTSTYSQPALDVRLDDSRIGGSPWGLNVDARARRTTRKLDDGTSDNDNRTKVYRAAVTRQGVDDPWNFTLGRQFSPAAASVSIFDGIAAEFSRPRFAVGLLSGTQPDPENYGYSTDLKEHGAYLQFRSAPESKRHWMVATGLIGSYEQSELNREFAYVQTRLAGSKFSVYATQEVDYNRSWKTDAGESALSPTSTFASLSYQPGHRVLIHAGYDNRRNVRLYRDFVNPVTQFDDSFRQGAWAGVTTQIAQRFSLSLDARTNAGGTAGTSNSYTLALGADRLAERFDVRTRSTEYENDTVRGWLHSVTGGMHIGQNVHFELGGGVRSEDSVSSLAPSQDLVWYNADLDVLLGRHFYLILSADHTQGDGEDVDQYYGGITYRF